ncbi:MAG: translational GTPase TypA, partial [Planctomycetota bacterium]
MPRNIRNVAIIAHVDHGKTTLVDALLRQSGNFRDAQLKGDAILDSNPLERERGITILAKNCAITYTDPESSEITQVNVIDTPGHADFGGEVERVMAMADGCLLLVDAAEGPMPQTRFVLQKAFDAGLKPIVVINKIDKPDQRAEEVLDEVFELFMELGADDETLDFPTVYASGRDGWASTEMDKRGTDIKPVFDALLNHVPQPTGDAVAALRLRVQTLDYSEYVGRIGIGRIYDGTLRAGQQVLLSKRDGSMEKRKVVKLLTFDGLGRKEVPEASAGDIVAMVGLEGVDIGDSVCDPDNPVPMDPIDIEPPTLTMVFGVNDSPLAGKEGKYVTARHLRDRLMRELESNVALQVEGSEGDNTLRVSGRGLMHLGILIETMRREGYELSVGKPVVVIREIDGVKSEPVERLVVDVPDLHASKVMELVGHRRGELQTMSDRHGIQHLEFLIPARGLIGLRTRLLTATKGEAIMHHSFAEWRPVRSDVPGRQNGVMIANMAGAATAFALFGLQERGEMFVGPTDTIYEGQIVAEHCRDNDLVVNVVKGKALNNIRTHASDE